MKFEPYILVNLYLLPCIFLLKSILWTNQTFGNMHVTIN